MAGQYTARLQQGEDSYLRMAEGKTGWIASSKWGTVAWWEGREWVLEGNPLPPGFFLIYLSCLV